MIKGLFNIFFQKNEEVNDIVGALSKQLPYGKPQWGGNLSVKLTEYGVEGKCAFTICLVCYFSLILFIWMNNQYRYCKLFAYNKYEKFNILKSLTCHFANIDSTNFALIFPPFCLFSLYFEFVYGTALFLVVTLLSLGIHIITLTLPSFYVHLLSEDSRLVIDQISNDGSCIMGCHGLFATYVSLYMLMNFKISLFIVPLLALADAVVTHTGFWGGYLAAYIMFFLA